MYVNRCFSVQFSDLNSLRKYLYYFILSLLIIHQLQQ